MWKEVYGDHVDDLHNTQNGELPGHDLWGEFPAPGKQAGEDEYYSDIPVLTSMREAAEWAANKKALLDGEDD